MAATACDKAAAAAVGFIPAEGLNVVVVDVEVGRVAERKNRCRCILSVCLHKSQCVYYDHYAYNMISLCMLQSYCV